jgi:putative transposase
MGPKISGHCAKLAPTLGPVIPFFAFSPPIRRIIYTTNAIEALNSKLRRAVRMRGHFPGDEAAMKLLHLVLNRAD